MSSGLPSPNIGPVPNAHGGHSGVESVRRLPAIQEDSWEFRKLAKEGSVMPNALVTGDVDNDGLEEIILGTTEGVLLVMKLEHREPIFISEVEATISVVLYSERHRRVVLVSLEGQCEVMEAFHREAHRTSSASFNTTFTTRPHEGMRVSSTNALNCHNCNSAPVSQLSSSSYRFNVPLNCTCGDLTTREDRSILFLGSDDRRVYVYSLASEGKSLGSLFVHAPVSSMKYFTASFATEACLSVMNTTASFSSKTASAQTTTGSPLLLVSTSEQLILLNVSCTDVKQWGDASLSLSVLSRRDTEGIISLKDVQLPKTIDCSLSDADPLFLEETTSSRKELRPLWHMSMDCISQPQQPGFLFSLEENRTHMGTLVSSANSRMVSSQSTSYTLNREESLASTNNKQLPQQRERGSTPFMASMRWGDDFMPLLELSAKSVFLPVAVDVAVAASKVQFAAVSENGRWAIFEMSPGRKGGSTERETFASDEHSEKRVFIDGNPVSFTCVAFGRFKSGELVPRVRIVREKRDSFRVVFLASNGNCYVVDSDNKVAVESHVRADASSFTILTGGCITQPMNAHAVCVSSAPTPVAATSTTHPLREHSGPPQLQINRVCGSIGGAYFLVCVTVDELIVSFVNREAHVSQRPCTLYPPGAGCGAQGSTLPLPVAAKNECPALSACGPGAKKQAGGGGVDEEAEEEERMALQLGIAILEAEGIADPSDVFSPEVLRFAARKLCAVGYSQEEWDALQQMEAKLSE